MNIDGYNIQPVGKKESFQFQCIRCGDCCRRIKDQVMLESMDAYRLTKHLQKTDPTIEEIGDMLIRYTNPVPLTETGFPIMVLKTNGEDDTCIFLTKDGCSAYEARPRACRMYPITVEPGQESSLFRYYLCREKPHHFVGGSVRVKDFLRKSFDHEAQAYVAAEYAILARIAKLLRHIPEHKLGRSVASMLFERYYNYNLEAPFLPQYQSNMLQLVETLSNLI